MKRWRSRLVLALGSVAIFGCDCEGLEGAIPGGFLDPAVLDLGPVPEGETCTANIALVNNGTADLRTNGASFVDADGDFSIAFIPANVGLGDAETLTLNYTAGAVGDRESATLEVDTNIPQDSILTATVTALPVAEAAAIAVSRCAPDGENDETPCPEVNFGAVQIDEAPVPVADRIGKTVQVKIVNDGNAPMTVSTALIDGGNGSFDVTGASLVGGTLEDFPVTVAAGRPEPCAPPSDNLCANRDTCNVLTLDVKFGPNLAGATAADLVVITDAAEGDEVRVPLTGVGSDVGILMTPAAVSFGNVAEGSTVDIDVVVSNIGSNEASVNNSCIDLGGDGTCDGECTGGDPALDGALSCDVFQADAETNEGKGFVLAPTDAVAGGEDERVIRVTWSPVSGNASIPGGTVLRLESNILGNAVFDAAIVGGSIGELVPDVDAADICNGNLVCIQAAGDTDDTTTWTGTVAFALTNDGDASLDITGFEWDGPETVIDDFLLEDDAGNAIDLGNPGITLAPGASVDLVVDYTNNDASRVDLPNLVVLHTGLGGELTIPMAVIEP
jgi:hypothetical protein